MSNPSGYRSFEPAPKSLCLCGSGIQFRECCKGRLPGFDIGKGWRELADNGRWLLVIKSLRADVTQYSIWHLSHTAPTVRHKPELRFAYFMNIDIEALSDHVEMLMWGYARYGWLRKLPTVLDRLQANIDDPRWLRKIAYHRGICALWDNNRDQAELEIKAIGPITEAEEDVDLLQIHVDLYGRQMGLAQRLAFFERIAELSSSRSDKLQYGGARAFEFLLAGDEAGARIAFEAIIATGLAMDEERPLSTTALIWFCKALEGRAVLDPDAARFAEIVRRLTTLLENPDLLSSVGRADVLRAIGDSHRYGGLFVEALEAYQASHDVRPQPELRTFEAECQLRRGEIDEAFRLIRAVSVDQLGAPERADHAFCYFYIALARQDRRSLLDARELLKSAHTPQPYFNTLRLEHLVAIGEALDAIDADREPPPINSLLSALKTASRYALLQPSIGGVGVNFNTIIDDLVARAEEKAQHAHADTPSYGKSK